jgi:hypothetical protein
MPERAREDQIAHVLRPGYDLFDTLTGKAPCQKLPMRGISDGMGSNLDIRQKNESSGAWPLIFSGEIRR